MNSTMDVDVTTVYCSWAHAVLELLGAGQPRLLANAAQDDLNDFVQSLSEAITTVTSPSLSHWGHGCVPDFRFSLRR